MSKNIFDAEAQVTIAPKTTISTTTVFPAVPVPGLAQLPASVCAIGVSAISASASSTFLLEAAEASTGPWKAIGQDAWEATRPPNQVAVGFSGASIIGETQLARPAFLRLTCTITTATITVQAWLSKVSGRVGLAAKPGDILANTI